MLKCDKCGFEGSRAEFKYIGQAQEIGAMVFRRCPACTNLVVCDEAEEDEKSNFTDVWELNRLRGKVFKGKKEKKEVKKNEM
ncbi:hypothetical protein HY02_05560 [Peptococcaceae bacterium SCADC1_2_3]|jgi:predicted RNA-binding Zn-ribbon protein involved in translation (DUF1610 family)|nr:hypothetical protein DK28_0204525 [Peptococcaceae bacterium SCADC1_2_3]KFI38232.1 hypothetical protein HY02_05560 [Peptococcaceae bacterium SCADC1_2_3]